MTKTQFLEGKITIANPSGGDGSSFISIDLNDVNSGLDVVRVHIPLACFSSALTGLAFQKCQFIRYKNDDKIGLKRETKDLDFPLPHYEGAKTRVETAIASAPTYADSGWEPRLYFGSQTSFSTKKGMTWAHTVQDRYVEPKPAAQPPTQHNSDLLVKAIDLLRDSLDEERGDIAQQLETYLLPEL